MSWTGKILGAFLGYLLAGPMGLVSGIVIGHYFDLGSNPSSVFTNVKRTQDTQKAFFRCTFLIMGFMAKADGRVSEEEIEMARNIMSSMMLTPKNKREAMEMFSRGKEVDFRLDDAIDTLLQYCGNQRNLLRMFLEIQIRAATAEGYIDRKKQAFLHHMSTRLQFNLEDFPLYMQSSQPYEYAPGHKKHGQYQRQQRQSYTKASSGPSELEKAYSLLGVTKEASDSIVKRAYRRKMAENHPDLLVSKGLPEQMIKIATEKTQAIKAAYDKIKQTRGIK
jgi:DnaJ like chaperone protein